MYDAYCMDAWDHTSQILASLDAIGCLITSLGSGSRRSPRSAFDFHPYRKRTKAGLSVSADDITPLKLLGNALARR